MKASSTDQRSTEASLRRSVRLVVLIDAAERAGIAPVAVHRLHTLAYLSNVLAPVWDIPVLDGKLLKERGGPFYPLLQQDLDRLVGTGVALISNLDYIQDQYGRWRLDGCYRLNRLFGDRILACVNGFAEEQRLISFIQELTYAVSALSDDDTDKATTEDATYADPVVDFGNVVDFAEWQQRNYAANAARQFDRLLPGGARASSGEKLHFYIRHLHERIHGVGRKQ